MRVVIIPFSVVYSLKGCGRSQKTVGHSFKPSALLARLQMHSGGTSICCPIAVGAGNPAGDPQAETLALFKGRTVLRTDQHGAIAFATDGEQLWVEGER